MHQVHRDEQGMLIMSLIAAVVVAMVMVEVQQP